jgi:hypothetical protein
MEIIRDSGAAKKLSGICIRTLVKLVNPVLAGGQLPHIPPHELNALQLHQQNRLQTERGCVYDVLHSHVRHAGHPGAEGVGADLPRWAPLCLRHGELGRDSPIFLQFFYLFSIFFLNRF